MHTEAPSDAAHPRVNLLLIIVFVALLWLPMMDSVLGLDNSPAVNENRERARMPEFTGWSSTRDYIRGIERYYDDHFGFRKRLVRWHSSWKRKIFHEAAVRAVIIGGDGWLFTAANEMIENFTGMKRFSRQDLETWQKLLESRRDWLAQRGIRYLVAITPDKHTLNPQYLPAWLKRAPGPGKLDQFLTHFNAHSTVPILDCRTTLAEINQREPVFLKTDTHWNQRGAFFAYQALITKLGEQLPGLAPLPESAFSWQNVPAPGDLAIMLGQETAFPEPHRWMMTPATLPSLQIEQTSMPSAKRVAVTTTRFAGAQGKAIVYHDSFGNAWMPLLGYHFAEVIYVAKRPIDPAFIEREKPLVVIDQIVERILNLKDPAVLLSDDGIVTGK